MASGSERKDIQNKSDSVDNPTPQNTREVALLGRAKFVVEDDQFSIIGKACSPDLIDLASACEEGRIGAVSAPKNDLNHPGASRLGERLNLIEIGRLLATDL